MLLVAIIWLAVVSAYIHVTFGLFGVQHAFLDAVPYGFLLGTTFIPIGLAWLIESRETKKERGILSTFDEKINVKQVEIARLYQLIDVERQEIHQLMVDHYTQEGVPLPVYVDNQGIIHAPEAFQKDVHEHVDDIMENITDDANLCIARDALLYYFLEHGFPKKEQEENNGKE